MTDRQRQIARHMLGLDSPTMRSYRNYFVANSDHADFVTLAEMQREGLVARLTNGPGSDYWFLTRAAAESVLLPGESLDAEDFPS